MPLALLLPAIALAGPPIPDDVKACMDAGRLWLAAPEYIEPATIGGERVYQIHDRLDGADGHILLYPRSCRVIVYVLSPPDRTGAVRKLKVTGPVSPAERALAFNAAGLDPFDPRSPRHAAARVLLTEDAPWTWRELEPGVRAAELPVHSTWVPGEPGVPSKSLVRDDGGEAFTVIDAPALRPLPVTYDAVVAHGADRVARPFAAGGSSVAAIALYDRTKGETSWLRTYELGERRLDVFRSGAILWFLGAPSVDGTVRLYGIHVDRLTSRAIEVRVSSGRVRASLTPRGLEAGAFTESGRVWPWSIVDRWYDR